VEILVAETAGFCFGVKRALELVQGALKSEDTPIYSVGPLIHNPLVVGELEKKGLKVVDDIEGIPAGRVVIRSHGVGPHVYEVASRKKLEIIDATCPFVKNVQQLAIFLSEQGYQVIIIGEKDHAEVRGVLDSVSGNALVISNSRDLEPERISPKVGIISQTTQDKSNFQQLVAEIIPHTKEVRVFNTICLATYERQKEAASLSKQVELMIVVGGKNSANTFRLVEISRNNGTTTFQVETPEEIRTDWFSGVTKVGVTAGASTPDQQILNVVEKIGYLGGKSDE
jgi:small subunit ribosomal protein S1